MKNVAIILMLWTMSTFSMVDDFKVVGYVRSSIDVSNMRYDKCTHWMYSFVYPADGNGNIGTVPSASKLETMVTKAHAGGSKVFLAIGGWMDGDDSKFETLASKPDARTRFCEQALSLVNQYDLDGIDMDWEYPDVGASAQNCALLMTELADTLHKYDKELSMAICASEYKAAAILDEVVEALDFMNLMTYDGGNHGTMEQFNDAIDYWIKRGAPKEKLIPGLPFYGRNSSNGAIAYKTIVAADPAYAYKNTYQGYYYNGIPTIKEKTVIAAEKCGGVMYWDDVMDSPNDELSLLMAINETVDSLTVTDNMQPLTASSYKNGLMISSVSQKGFSIVNPVEGKYTVSIFSPRGRLLQKKTEYLQSGVTNLSIDISKGARLLSIEGENKKRFFKAIVH